MADQSFDLIVIGGGPGGYVAAIRAAQLGMKVAVVEREHLGGICLNWGCIPTKALLRSSEINHLLHHLGDYGFAADNIRFDLDKVVKRSRAVAKQLASGVGHLLRKNKVTVFDGSGALAGKNTVAVSGKANATITAPHIILATGARARQLPGMESDGKLIWSYKEAMVPQALPKSLLVIGSGAIGIEFASFFRNMGAEVTVVEVLDRVLPVEDEEISAFAHKAFEKQGMRIMVGANVKGAKKGRDNVTVSVEANGKGQEITADRVISAVGIVGNVEEIGLEGTGVKVDRT
ncbi:MAG: FAD-dependent oxidoreductase, partial [Acetobacteraceae bacterium]|nr:FAD-dependent oxidoreductase [Acetobacteraceae bacterium]